MEDLIETLTRGNVAQVKTVVASVALALAVYQVMLIAVGYGKVRLPFLGAGPASATHRASGDTIAVLVVLVGTACLAEYGFDDDNALHAYAGAAVLGVFTLKIAVVRLGLGLGRFLPVLGTCLLAALALAWATSAAGLLGDS